MCFCADVLMSFGCLCQAVGEAICGPYEWGIYDVLLLPPSFPYGGMENPCLTFVTPTLLAGDKSQATVIAHEVTHSWMGCAPQTWTILSPHGPDHLGLWSNAPPHHETTFFQPLPRLPRAHSRLAYRRQRVSAGLD